MFSMKDIIVLAIRIEKNAAAIYTRASAQTADPALAATLQCLVEDEKRHARQLSELMNTIQDSADSHQLEELGQSLMQDVIGEQGFSLSEADFEHLKLPEDLLALAAGFEQDKQKFYHLLQSFAADDAAANLLETIILEESRHLEHLQQLMDCKRKEKTPSGCALC